MPSDAANITPPSRRYITGSLPAPYRAKNRASTPLCAIMSPAADENAVETAKPTAGPSPARRPSSRVSTRRPHGRPYPPGSRD